MGSSTGDVDDGGNLRFFIDLFLLLKAIAATSAAKNKLSGCGLSFFTGLFLLLRGIVSVGAARGRSSDCGIGSIVD